MTTPPRPRFWTGPRLFALGASALVLAVFVAANVNLVAVASKPECALQTPTGGVAYRAAKSSC